MFKRMNPKIDYDALEERVRARLASHLRRDEAKLPAWEAAWAYTPTHQGAWVRIRLRKQVQRMCGWPVVGRPIEYLIRVSRPWRQSDFRGRLQGVLRRSFDRVRGWPLLGAGLEWGVTFARLHRLKALVVEMNHHLGALRQELSELQQGKQDLEARLDDQSSQLEEQEDRIGAQEDRIGAQQGALDAQKNALDRHDATLEGLRGKEEGLEQSVAARKQEVQQLREAMTLRQDHRPTQASEGAEGSWPPEPEGGACDLWENAFYEAFEDRFRGEETEVGERLEVYLDWLHQCSPVAERPVVDLGCGRGEWLGLLQGHGFQAEGVDTNPTAVARCRERGLTVSEADLEGALGGYPAGSVGAVSVFHVAEHLPFGRVMAVLAESLRVLAPGGLILMETPNPENLTVGAHTFYLDPTHRRPIPPQLLEFMAEYAGFAAVSIERLHPIPEAHQAAQDSELARRVNEALYGPQDYALIAHKGGSGQEGA